MKKFNLIKHTSLMLLLYVLSLGMAQAAEPFRLCTGSPGKTYFKVGKKFAELATQMSDGQLAIEVITTKGSVDNLRRIAKGECDGAIAQGDAVVSVNQMLKKTKTEQFLLHSPLYKELSLLICSRDSGIDDIEELTDQDNATVAAGAMGSGSLATWITFKTIDPDYDKVKVLPKNGAAGALAVIKGEAQCLLEVIAPQSDFLESLNANQEIGEQLKFAEVDDNFEDYKVDGQTIYTQVEFDDEKYPNLSTTGDPEILAITAYLVIGKAWADKHPDELSTVSMTVLLGKADIESIAYGDEKPFDE